MRKSVGQRIPEKEIAKFQFVGVKINNLHRNICQKWQVFFFC
nr:MAG TPA: hypothetical protein [Caudoviricetes sp.]